MISRKNLCGWGCLFEDFLWFRKGLASLTTILDIADWNWWIFFVDCSWMLPLKVHCFWNLVHHIKIINRIVNFIYRNKHPICSDKTNINLFFLHKTIYNISPLQSTSNHNSIYYQSSFNQYWRALIFLFLNSLKLLLLRFFYELYFKLNVELAVVFPRELECVLSNWLFLELLVSLRAGEVGRVFADFL